MEQTAFKKDYNIIFVGKTRDVKETNTKWKQEKEKIGLVRR